MSERKYTDKDGDHPRSLDQIIKDLEVLAASGGFLNASLVVRAQNHKVIREEFDAPLGHELEP